MYLCAEAIWRTSYNTSHVYLFLPVSYHTCATCLLFCLIYILVWWKLIKEKKNWPFIIFIRFRQSNVVQIFPVVEMVTGNGSQKWDPPPVSWLCVFVKGSGMSVLLKEFSLEISQANKVSGECVWRIFKILHHANISSISWQCFFSYKAAVQYSVLYITARYLNWAGMQPINIYLQLLHVVALTK